MRTALLLLLIGCGGCGGAPAKPDLHLDDGAAAIIAGPTGDLEIRGWGLVPGGRPVLLVHGIMADASYWSGREVFIRSLGRPVVAVSLRGRGRTAAPTEPGGYHPEQQAEDLLAVLDALGARDAHVVAHSMGVPVALAFYKAHRNRVSTLTMGDYLPGWVHLTGAWLANAQARTWPGVPPEFAPAIVADQANWGAGGTRVQLMPNQTETLLPSYQSLVSRLRVPTTVYLGRQSMSPVAGMLWWSANIETKWLESAHTVFAEPEVGPAMRAAWDTFEAE